jgi:hypothetical protein
LADQHRWQIARGRCFEPDFVVPYAPLFDLLRTHTAGKTNAEMKAFLGPLASTVAKLLPELAIVQSIHDPIPELDPEAEKRRIFEAFIQILITAIPGPRGRKQYSS